MRETGTAIRVDGETVTVGCTSTEGCASCAGRCASGKREIRAANRAGLAVAPGDGVDIYLPPGRTVLAGFVALILPLLLFVGGFFVGRSLLPGGGEGVGALFGMGGLAAGFGVSVLYGRSRRGAALPEVVSVRPAPAVPISGESGPAG